ncbi:MAG TPA: hypothetical protein VL992_13150 [Tepidisphaeraceae bacterium]|nr:hypothetical protein [Tepidisphaeraceae bacterium]
MSSEDSGNLGKSGSTGILVGLCGLMTCLLTGVFLWWAERRYGIVLYGWMHWYVIPLGAILSGVLGASGYYAGMWIFGHKPTAPLLVWMLTTSAATFVLVHYLSYATLQVHGRQVSRLISFPRYLQIVIENMSLRIYTNGTEAATGKLGAFGYVIAGAQVLGFALGGFAVYRIIRSKPYCDKCLRYLSRSAAQKRFTQDPEGYRAVMDDLQHGETESAMRRYQQIGERRYRRRYIFLSTFEIRHCRGCRREWVNFVVRWRDSRRWVVNEATRVRGFADELRPEEPVQAQPTAIAA